MIEDVYLIIMQLNLNNKTRGYMTAQVRVGVSGNNVSWFAFLSFLLSLTKRNHLVTPTLLGLQNLEKFSKELLEIKSYYREFIKNLSRRYFRRFKNILTLGLI